MTPRFSIFVCIVLLAMMVSISCSGSGAESGGAIIPPVQDLTAQSEVPDARSGHYLWGYYVIVVDPEEKDFEMIPLRQVAGHWNTLIWLEQIPCTNCMNILGYSDSGNDTLLFEVQLTHPFTIANLTGFDVRGIPMFQGSHVFAASGLNTPDGTAGDGELVNADGYTTLYNITTIGSGPEGLQGYIKGKGATAIAPNAVLNGYKRHVSPGDENTRNAFYAASSVTATYEIDMPDGQFIFGYGIDASWASATNKPVTDPMNDFPPKANCSEPWKVDVIEQPIGQGLTGQGGETVLVIDAYDYQGKASHSPPIVECEDLFDGELDAAWKEDGDGYSRFEVTVGNQKSAVEGEYRCLVSVEDEMNSVSPDWMDLTGYQIITLQVTEFIPQCKPPVAAAAAEPVPQTVCEPVHFFDDGSFDPDGEIVKHEWDWENDGVYDEEGDDVYHTWDELGTYYVQYRVTDDSDATDVLDTPLEILIENALPTAVAEASQYTVYVGEQVDFFGTDSYDNDCGGELIVQWEWDWENDGVYDDTGETASHSYGELGEYEVQLRVTDDEGGTDTLDELLGITVTPELFPPVAIAGVDPIPQTVCEPVHFYDDGSFDPDGGLIELYEWDWDNDGVYDEEGAAVDHTWDTPGAYHVQFRVMDDEGATDELDQPLAITISNALPTAVAEANQYTVYVGEQVDFSGTDSYDNDCGGELIVQWEWDWEKDGVYDDTGETASHTYGDLGEYEVQLRVTDDEGGTDILDDPLSIAVVPEGWVRTWGGIGYDPGYGVATDSLGNIYVVGEFANSVDFDPGEGLDVHVSNGFCDVFLTKFDSTGAFLWAQSWGGPSVEIGHGVAIDGFGNAYVTGYYNGTVDFDPGLSTENHSSIGDEDVYVSSFTATGAFRWARTWGGISEDKGNDVAANEMGDIYVTGYFFDWVDFNPGSGQEWHLSYGYDDPFLSKFDSNGNFQWACTWGGTHYDEGRAVAADDSGNVFVTGVIYGLVDFDPGPGIDQIGTTWYDMYITKFASSGAHQWASVWGGSNTDFGKGVDVDGAGFVYVTGKTYTNGTTDAFLCKYSPAGSLQKALTWGASSNDSGWSLSVDETGSVYVTGYFEGTVDFDPGSGVENHSSNGGRDAFVSKFDASTVLLWTRTWGGLWEDTGNGVATDLNGNAYIAGQFNASVDFDPSASIEEHASNGGNDTFLLKLLPNGYWY